MEQINKTLGEDLPGVEVLDEKQIATLFTLQKRGWSIKAMSRELGWSRHTIRAWLKRGPDVPRPMVGRPKKLADEEDWLRERFKSGVRNGDVLRQELAERGVHAGIRTVERAVEKYRQEIRCAEAATLRFETEPGKQLQIDFGEKWVTVAGARVKVFVFVATLGYSRRTFARIYPRNAAAALAGGPGIRSPALRRGDRRMLGGQRESLGPGVEGRHTPVPP